MNNFRFINSGKRVRRASFTLGAGGSINWGEVVRAVYGQAELNNCAGLIKLSHITFEIDSQASGNAREVEGFVLERPMSIVATNNTGVDGTYKVPEDFILAKWNYAIVAQETLPIVSISNVGTNETVYVNVFCHVVE